MKKTFLLLASVTLGAMLFACGGGKTEVTPEQMKLDSAEFTVEGLQKMVTSPEVVTPVEYRALILAYSKVGINKEKLELDDNPVDEAIREVFKEKEKPQTKEKILKGMLNSPYPQVRAYVMAYLPRSANDTVMDVLEQEKDPYVIKKGLAALRYKTDIDRVTAFFVSQASHPAQAVRKEVAMGLGRTACKDKPGVKETVLKLMQDSDTEVKRLMCRDCGNLYDESFIPELVKIMDDPAQAEVHGACVESLYKLWYDYPFHKHTSQAAYDATMAYFKKTPRTDKVPAWDSVGKLRSKNESNYDEWAAKATYFKPAEYVAVMMDLAIDPKISWLGRAAAVGVINEVGTKADLQKVKSAISANKADDTQASLVLKELERAMKK